MITSDKGRIRVVEESGNPYGCAVLDELPKGSMFAIKDGFAHRVMWHEFR